MSNLIATGQIRGGDLLRVDYDEESQSLTFFKDDENMPAHIMARMIDTAAVASPGTLASEAVVELPKLGRIAKISKR